MNPILLSSNRSMADQVVVTRASINELGVDGDDRWRFWMVNISRVRTDACMIWKISESDLGSIVIDKL